ncbi:MAG: hypothetical protein ACKVIV_08260 [Flavobacteriales bacterium]|jgi:hypothetical protein|tara:strand:- start:10268 stop:10720 length:453 start_codon:yes stop_codon:yes gene_type:complete
MINDFDLFIDRLNDLEEETLSKWGIMSSSQMIFHCNTFIVVSLGDRKINLIIRVFSRVFFRYFFLKYLNSIDFDIYKFKKNSSTLPIFKSFPEIIDFDIEKNKLIQNLKKVELISSVKIHHQMYGTISTITLKKLVSFHTSYHFNQFDLL